MSDPFANFPAVEAGFPTNEDLVRRILIRIGEDPTRAGLLETPKRVVAAWKEWFSGYSECPDSYLRTFEDGAEDVNQMVLVNHIPVFSHCEHHMTPFIGEAWVAYIPDGKIVGLSKFSRVVDAYSRRLQVQERITTEVANCINSVVKPQGVGVLIKAKHLCMCSRGVMTPDSETITSALRGCFMEDGVKAEFHRLCGF